MDIYHGWCNLKPGAGDMDFADAFARYMDHLKSTGKIASWRLTRRKLGLGPSQLGEFHFMIEVEGLAQLDEAFSLVATRASETEGVHHGVNSLVKDVQFALYRDFPDPMRQRGEEKF